VTAERAGKRLARPRLEIERTGSQVRFTLHCADEYAAMILYDQATAQARAGGLDLTVATLAATSIGGGE
jgi:hypothetical protein